jgi:predicted PolB exonuclease-like 3'-5' exonuclease
VDTESGEERTFCGPEERDLLTAFWKLLDEQAPALFVTFNGKSFDFPFVNIRSAILQVSPTLELPLRRYTTYPHFDVREVLSGYDRHRRGSLDYFCAVFGIPSPKENMDGAAVGAAYHDGRIEEIATYCLADCRATAALYERLKPFFSESI